MYVYALSTTTLTNTVSIRRGEVWDASDPIVTRFPAMFSSEPPEVRTSGAVFSRENQFVPGPIESATAAPGERRNARVK